MTAQALQFTPRIQDALDQGCLSPESAWRLEWDLEPAQLFQPWHPIAMQAELTLLLFHWEPEMLAQ